MSLDAKIRLINGLKEKLADKFTLKELNSLAIALNEELAHYKVELDEKYLDSTEDLIEFYISALKVEGKSPRTLKRYEYIIRRFLKDVKIPTEKLSVFNIRAYFVKEKNRGVQDSTLDGVRQILNAYFSWLHREGILLTNPMGNIGTIKAKKKILEILSDVDIELMKSHCKNDKDLAIIMFLLTTGCRVDEVRNLDRSSINFSTYEVKVLGKGNKERIVYINPVVAMQLKKYFDGRKDDDPCLFRSKYGRITVSGIETILHDLEKRSGVKHIHPHKFRRTLATNLIKKGMPIEKVAAILGHEKIDTTMKYIVLDNSEIKHAYERYA